MTAPPIDTLEAASAAIAELQDPVALDAEFHAEFRYHPRPMLLQLRGHEGPTHLVDLRRVDLAQLTGLAGRALIAHAPGQDLRILRRAGLEPGPVVDTQVLAGFAGLGFPRTLEDLLREVLDRAAPRGATLSDWSRRPLTERQLEYARADVAHLHELAAALRQRVPRALDPAVEECTRELQAPPSPARAWERIRAHTVMGPAQLRILRRLALWREDLAERNDHPPHQIASDACLVDLARRRPASVEAMLENRRFPKRVAKQHGAAVLPLLAEADDAPWDHARHARQDAARLALEAWVARQALERGIAARLLLPPATIGAVIQSLGRGESPGSPLSGWREDLLETEMSRFVIDAKLAELLSTGV